MEELRFGDGPVEAVLLPEAGARLHRLRAFGHDLLRTPGDPVTHRDDPIFWGAYVMAPWCNRIAAAPTRVGGRTVTVAPNFPDGSAIHGQVFDRPWAVRDGVLTIAAGGDGWPWRYEVAMRVGVRGAHLRLALALTNRSEDPMPAGLGLHPWWRRPCLVGIPAADAYRTNLEADAAAVPVTGEFDLRSGGLPAEGLDGTWTDLDGGAIELAWPDLDLRASLRLSDSLSHLAVATPSGLDAIAVEPQTHAPGGLARLLRGDPGGLNLLAPGATLEATLVVQVSPGHVAPG